MKLGDLISKSDKTIVKLIGNFSESDFILKCNSEVEEDICKKILNACERNSKGEPLAYILGERAFFRDVFKVRKGVLIPQPDTEILVEEAVKFAKSLNSDSFSVLDLCAGSGCIGISVAKELADKFKAINLYLSDISPVAYECFSENAKLLVNEPNIIVHPLLGNLFDTVGNTVFDAVLSNPPYIATDVIPTLPIEVRNEPLLALDGGKDGLDFYRKIADRAKSHMKKESALIMEIGYDQAIDVKSLLLSKQYRSIEVVKDLGGNDRVVKAFIK